MSRLFSRELGDGRGPATTDRLLLRSRSESKLAVAELEAGVEI